MRPLCSAVLAFFALTAFADTDCQRGFHAAEPLLSVNADSIAYGDFNEDGLTDIVMTTLYSRIVALNRGGGVFEPQPREALPGSIAYIPMVAAVDINRDGHLDLLYRHDGNFVVALGNGDGTFRAPIVSGSGNTVSDWRQVDLNHDGSPDFIGITLDERVDIEVSNGDGTFRNVGGYFIPPTADPTYNPELGAGDFDGDGDLDVVRVGTKTTQQMAERFVWNDGPNRFTVTDFDVLFPDHFIVMDIDGDGADELVASENGDLVIGRAKTHKFTIERIRVAAPGTTLNLSNPMLLDADGDGIRDLVLGYPGAVAILRGRASGGFAPIEMYAVPESARFAAVDLDGDGRVDFASTSSQYGPRALYGASIAAGTPNANRYLLSSINGTGLDLADVDGDGIPDIVAKSSLTSLMQVFFGDGKGGYPRSGAPTPIGADTVFVADYDGDGRADLAKTMVKPDVATPYIEFGSPDGVAPSRTFLDGVRMLGGRVSLGPLARPALVGLQDNDIVLITLSSTREATITPIGRAPAGATLFVIPGPRGTADQIGVSTVDGGVVALLNDGGTWRQQFVTARPQWSDSIIEAWADFDGDGNPDYVRGGFGVSVLFGTGGDAYEEVGAGQTPGTVNMVKAADFDGDGRVDLIIGARSGQLQILRNGGGRRFEQDGAVLTASALFADAVVDDVTGDGRPDVLLNDAGGIEVLPNVCAAPLVKVAAIPRVAAEGAQVRLVINVLPPLSAGVVRVSEGGRTLAEAQPDRAYDLATVVWSSPPLTPGAHTYTIEYRDQYAGTSETTITVGTLPPSGRRRTSH